MSKLRQTNRFFVCGEGGGIRGHRHGYAVPPRMPCLCQRHPVQGVESGIPRLTRNRLRSVYLFVHIKAYMSKLLTPQCVQTKNESHLTLIFFVRRYGYSTFYALRRRGDSNPRYSYPYDSLANCWFKPLTHLSFAQGANPFTICSFTIYHLFGHLAIEPLALGLPKRFF